jgi:hypothetical protein
MAYVPFTFGTDVHGDMADEGACRGFHKFVKDFKPKIRIASEVWDFRSLRKKATKLEQQEGCRRDLNAGLAFLEEFKPTHYLRGNHCERMWDAAAGVTVKGITQEWAEESVAKIEKALKGYGCKSFPYHKRTGILKIGHLKFLHGFFCGTNAARQHALAYGSCLFGHGHAIDVASIAGCERRVARMVGCLCRLDMDYNRAAVNSLRYAHGFAYGVIDDRTGDYQVFQAEGVNGKFVVAGDVKVIAA